MGTGIKRMGRGAYADSRTALIAFLRPIVHDIVLLAEHGQRFTVKVTDVLLALKRNGRWAPTCRYCLGGSQLTLHCLCLLYYSLSACKNTCSKELHRVKDCVSGTTA